MGAPVKGTVTSLASLFPPEETQKASERVRGTISERQKELDLLQEFLHDNSSLVNHVQKLPDQLHHHIMVPFGKAAFFPGRLIHTNEFMVLLGEGYFAERTSKQTVEILKRRGKGLESQIDGLKAVMQDLNAEISFFNDTAAQIAAGGVDIREDYSDDASSEDLSRTGVPKPEINSSEGLDTKAAAAVEDEEYARLFSRMEELEKAELEAENDDNSEKDDDANLDYHLSESELESSEKQQSECKHASVEGSIKDQFKQEFSDRFDFESSKAHSAVADKYLDGNVPASSRSDTTENEKFVEFPMSKESRKVAPASTSEVSVAAADFRSSSSKAFTGSIIEHTHNIESNLREQKSAPTSKPVSRFKQQRR